MRVMVLLAVVAVVAVAACGGKTMSPDSAAPLVPVANPNREIVDTKLAFDLAALTATATITLGPAAAPGGATLEVGDLEIQRIVRESGEEVAHAPGGTRKIDLAVPAADEPIAVTVTYKFKAHEMEGASLSGGYTLLWPYHCGNLFPCHSDPADGTTFSLEVTGVPVGRTAVFPATIPTEAPSYQIAWAIDAYTETPLGTTTAGTQLVVWHRAADLAKAQTGTAQLVAAFDWMEKNIGPYRYGPKAGTVAVNWGPGGLGGMEHHPYWHVGTASLGDVETNVHEAAHGWFGDGIRIQCWEDFVLSEGTVTYLAGRALDAVAPTVGTAIWQRYQTQLASVPGTNKVWPLSCGAIDVLEDNLFTRAPYLRGAFFYRAVALRLGNPELLDQALAAFYAAHAGRAATMAAMLEQIRVTTGYDAAACADLWLHATTTPAVGPCPS